jgi:hypothetical protein
VPGRDEPGSTRRARPKTPVPGGSAASDLCGMITKLLNSGMPTAMAANRSRSGRHAGGCAASVKIPRARQELPEERGPIDQPLGDEMRDAVLLLQLTVHLEQP